MGFSLHLLYINLRLMSAWQRALNWHNELAHVTLHPTWDQTRVQAPCAMLFSCLPWLFHYLIKSAVTAQTFSVPFKSLDVYFVIIVNIHNSTNSLIKELRTPWYFNFLLAVRRTY